ncbi:MAG: hypothetical protein ACYCV7_09515 [Acidimicrobiales bacterium]
MSDTPDTRPAPPRWRTGIPNRLGDSPVPGAARGVASVVCGLLAIQFLLGMYVNIYVNLPPNRSGTQGSGGSMMGRFGTMFSSGGLLMAHMMLGMLLVASGVVALVVAASSEDRFAVGWSATGLVAILVAGYGGMSFFMFGHSNADSYLMAVGFLVSFAAYLTGALRGSASGPLLRRGFVKQER